MKGLLTPIAPRPPHGQSTSRPRTRAATPAGREKAAPRRSPPSRGGKPGAHLRKTLRRTRPSRRRFDRCSVQNDDPPLADASLEHVGQRIRELLERRGEVRVLSLRGERPPGSQEITELGTRGRISSNTLNYVHGVAATSDSGGCPAEAIWAYAAWNRSATRNPGAAGPPARRPRRAVGVAHPATAARASPRCWCSRHRHGLQTSDADAQCQQGTPWMAAVWCNTVQYPEPLLPFRQRRQSPIGHRVPEHGPAP